MGFGLQGMGLATRVKIPVITYALDSQAAMEPLEGTRRLRSEVLKSIKLMKLVKP
jgi:hypothetical protein